MHGPSAERIQTMHHVQEICIGKTSSPDDSKFSPGSAGVVSCRKMAQNKIHFRTIAPKGAPKIVPSCLPSFPPSAADIAAPNTKPFVMQTQNYALMKVAGQDGTFSLVAVPQVTAPVGRPVIQTAGIPLQENLKLPIPRYKPSQERNLPSKKPRVQNQPKVDHPSVIQVNKEIVVKANPKEDIAAVKFTSVAEDTSLEKSLFQSCRTQVVNVNNSSLPFKDTGSPSILSATSPIKLSLDIERAVGSRDSGSLVKREATKVIESAKHATVLSPVVFGSPVHLLTNAPKGKLPILPYSKMKKNIISNSKQVASPSKLPQLNVSQCGPPTSSSDGPTTAPASGISQTCTTPAGPCPPAPKPAGSLYKQNGVSGRMRARKRKPSSEILKYQTKMRLIGKKLIVCKERAKTQMVKTRDRKGSVGKKYRNIMPKPFVDSHGVASPSGSSSVLQGYGGDVTLRNHVISLRTHRWRQSDIYSVSQGSYKLPSLSVKPLYKCHICDHSFQFKHHLQDHLNSHSNKRPYHCRLCRKAYVHSGSLSTHMKLHHSDSRLKKLMCCEFCAKVFGHIRVYFGHLKEVHRVIISTESANRQAEKKTLTHTEEANALHRDKSASEDHSLQEQMEEIRLQIRCGRCPFTASTFADMKLHLLCEHGEEFQEVLQEAVLEKRHGAQEELVKHATHHWKLLNEKRSVVKCPKCHEEIVGTSRLRKHVCPSDSVCSESEETEPTLSVVEGEAPWQKENAPSEQGTEIQFCCGKIFNCLLCKQVFEVQADLLEHWKEKHNCEEPLVLWTIFSSLSKIDK
ncbi:zinc finger protein 438 [Hyperolius riggenbachi]|uniref:zinc finger protein 438 n=1 Tax=Hyperolius riggenbachi TaxID=752182 RepID=UPI0035A2F02C